MLLTVLRAIFILALAGVAMIFLAREDTVTGDTFASISHHKDLAMLTCIGLGLVIIAVDIFIPRKTLSAISGLFFGLIVGMVVAFGLSLIVDLMVKSFFPDLRIAVYADVPIEEWVIRGPTETERSGTDSDNGETDREKAGTDMKKPERVKQTSIRKEEVGSRDHPFISAMKLGIGVICCYLSVSFILQTKDDVRFVIPYVEFAKQTKGMRPMILDTSVIIDGRITDIAETGIVESEIVIPRFVLQELQAIADSADRLKRNRGRRGLDMLNKLQLSEKTDIRMLENRAEAGESGSVDERLVDLAKSLDGRLVTNDFNLNKLAQLRGVTVVNINDLSNALRPVFLQGEQMTIKVVKAGEEMGQGVGYLEDGTMVVIEGGRDHIGEAMPIVVTNVLQTSAGRMIFGRSDDGTGPTTGRRRPRTGAQA